jgi:hypothetical protein
MTFLHKKGQGWTARAKAWEEDLEPLRGPSQRLRPPYKRLERGSVWRGNLMREMQGGLYLSLKPIGFIRLLTASAILATAIATAAAQDAGPPKLHTNEADVEEATQATALASAIRWQYLPSC